MEAELAIGLGAVLCGSLLELDVQCAEVGQNWRLFGAGISEVKRPFHGREVAVLDAHAAQHQPGFRIAIGERVLCLVLIEASTGAL